MAPPKVDLNNKEKSPDGIPDAIVIDQAGERSRVCAQRQLNRRRKRCKAAVVVLVVGILIIAVALPVMIYMRRHHRREFGRWCGTDNFEKRVPEHVRIDFDKNLIYVNNSHVGDFGESHALHDYNKKISVFRDPEHKRCYVEPLHKSFEDGVDEWDRDDDEHEDDDDNHFRKSKRLYVTRPPMEHGVAEHYWGKEVADHCKGHQFHMIKPIERPPPKDKIDIIVKIASVDAIRIIFIHIERH